jgi:hypothetical protein
MKYKLGKKVLIDAKLRYGVEYRLDRTTTLMRRGGLHVLWNTLIREAFIISLQCELERLNEI